MNAVCINSASHFTYNILSIYLVCACFNSGSHFTYNIESIFGEGTFPYRSGNLIYKDIVNNYKSEGSSPCYK